MAAAPKYQLIADALRAQIADGSYAPGAKLPGERELHKKHDVALETVRRALKTLVQEGLIEQRHGSGTYVRGFRPIVRDANKRLSFEQWGAGRSIWDADLGKRPVLVESAVVVEDAPEWVADLLGSTRVVMRDRVFAVEGKLVQLAVSYYPADIAAGTLIEQADTGPGGAPARLNDLGFKQTNFRESVRVRMPTAVEAQKLALGPGQPVAEIVREAATNDGRVVEVTRMVLVGEAYVLQWSFTS